MKTLFVTLSLSLLSSIASADKCIVGGDIFQTEITFERNFHNGQILEIIAQEMVRGVADGEPRKLTAELINNYRKGWTYRVHLEDDFYGIIDDHAGKGSFYVNLIFGQGSTGLCKRSPVNP